MKAGLRQGVDDLPTLHEFWRQPAPDGNDPEAYTVPLWRSRALLELIDDLPRDAAILEVGCNVGRNLAFLFDNGFTELSGVEISPHAVSLLRRTYPQLEEADIRVGPAEEILADFEDSQFDLVFTMAVLEHIHPDSTQVFDGMVRAGGDVLAIEPEGHQSHRQHPHDIVSLFTRRGMRLVSETPLSRFPYLRQDPAISDYFAWRFSPGGDRA